MLWNCPSSSIHRGNPNTRGTFRRREYECERVKVYLENLTWAGFDKTSIYPDRSLCIVEEQDVLQADCVFSVWGSAVLALCGSFRLTVCSQSEGQQCLHFLEAEQLMPVVDFSWRHNAYEIELDNWTRVQRNSKKKKKLSNVRVPNQDGISQAYYTVEIHHSGPELLIWIYVTRVFFLYLFGNSFSKVVKSSTLNRMYNIFDQFVACLLCLQASATSTIFKTNKQTNEQPTQ